MNEIKEFVNQYYSPTILYILLGFLVINYLIALYKSHKKTIIAISDWFDLVLVLVPTVSSLILIVIVFIIRNENPKGDINILLLCYGITCGIAIIWTLRNSIISNKDNLLNIAISFFAKIFVMLISVLFIFFFFFRINGNLDKNSKNKDAENKKASKRWRAGLAAIAGVLIFSLITRKKKTVTSDITEDI